MNNIIKNTYNLSGNYGVGYTSKNQTFYFDKQDYDKIKTYCWYIDNSTGYVKANIKGQRGKRCSLHNLIMDEKYIDHINGNKLDNRKSNLRTSSGVYSFNTYNQMNKRIQKNNTSGKAGVSWNKKSGIWESYINIGKRRIHLGRTYDYEEAVQMRTSAENKYFGEWSYLNSQRANNI